MKLRKITIATCATALAFIALGGCKKEDIKKEAVTKSEKDEIPIIDVDVVRTENVAQTKEYTANVEAFNSNNISPASMNRIETITVDVGDKVAKGQTIATLDRSALDQLKVNINQIELDYNRAVQLLNIGSGTQAAVDQYKSQLDAARTQYNNLLDNTVLKSPMSGVVTARNYDPGDMTGSMPIVTIGQINPSVKIIINITENDLADVKTGLPVKVNFDAFQGQEFNGKIARIYPNVDPTTRTFQAEVQVSNPNSQILPGMFARVSLDHGINNHVVVPDRAVVKQPGSGNRYVYVYRNGKVFYNQVEVGRQVDDGYEIISGVNDGDTVVIAGQTRLADGVQAKIKEKTAR